MTSRYFLTRDRIKKIYKETMSRGNNNPTSEHLEVVLDVLLDIRELLLDLKLMRRDYYSEE